MYFDQQVGALQAIHWSKLSFSAFKQVFPSFSITSREKEDKAQKIRLLRSDAESERKSYKAETNTTPY